MTEDSPAAPRPASPDSRMSASASEHTRQSLILAGRYLRSAYFGTGIFNIILVGVGSIGGLFLARVLGPSHRGDLVIILAWPAFVGSIAGLGIPQAVTYRISRSEEDACRVIPTATALAVGYGGLAAIAGVVASSSISRDPVVVLWLRVRFSLLPVDIAMGAWSGGLQALDLRHWNYSRAVQPVSYLVAVLTLMLLGRLDVSTAAAAAVASVLLQAVVIGRLLLMRVDHIDRPSGKWVGPLLGYGVRSLASGAPWLVNSQIDQVILSLTVSAAALGSYAIAVSISQLCLPLSTAFGAVAFPRIAGASRTAEAKTIERKAILGGVAAAVGVLIPLAVLAPLAIDTVLGSGYRPAIVAFWLLVPGAAAFATNYVLSDILRGWGRPLAAGVGEGVAALVTIVLLALLVPALGIKGASIASSCAYLSTTAVLLWMLRHAPSRIATP